MTELNTGNTIVGDIDLGGYMAALREQGAGNDRPAPFRIARPLTRDPGSPGRARSADEIDLQALMVLDGVEFVQEAFLRLLGRQADPSAYATYLEPLTDAPGRKLTVLKALLDSEEGRGRAVRIPALDPMAKAIARRPYDATLKFMLQYDGLVFVTRAYAILLDREPDESALELRLSQAGAGRSGKILLLEGLCDSAEGRRRKANVRGLAFAILCKKLYEDRVVVARHLYSRLLGGAPRRARRPNAVSIRRPEA